MEQKTLLQQIELFELELMQEYHQHSLGITETINTETIYKKFNELFKKEHITTQKTVLKTLTDHFQKREHTYLLKFFIEHWLEHHLTKLSDTLSNKEASATVTWKDKKIPLRQLGIEIANTPEQQTRKQMYELSIPIKEELLKLEKEILEKANTLRTELGYNTEIELYKELKEVDYKQLLQQLLPLLTQTETIYTHQLKKLLKQHNLYINNIHHYDLSFLMRAKQFDTHFPKEQAISTLKQTWLSLGFDLNTQKNIIIDAEERPKKVPRAYCMPLKVPQEVHLVIKPKGGQDDYQALLHESGHSQHYANTNNELPYPFKHMGDHAVSETYAFLLEYLTLSKEWLTTYTSLKEESLTNYLDFNWLINLFFVRRYIAKFIYEMKFYSNDLRKLDKEFQPTNQTYNSRAAMYNHILTQATHFDYPEINYLSDIDSGFYVADYLRAWVMEAQLRSVLINKFTNTWFTNKEAGDYLKTYWTHGNKLNINEIAKQAGFQNLDIQPLLQQLSHPPT